MRYSRAGIDIRINMKFLLQQAAEKVVQRVEKEVVRLHFKTNPFLVGINWKRSHFEPEEDDE